MPALPLETGGPSRSRRKTWCQPHYALLQDEAPWHRPTGGPLTRVPAIRFKWGLMSTAEKTVLTSGPMHPLPSVREVQPQPDLVPHGKPWWQKLAVPALVLVLAAAIVVTITRNWNAWEGGRIEQVTDDAFVRGDVTPLSTKVAGIVRDVNVSDFQQVHKGDLLVALQD